MSASHQNCKMRFETELHAIANGLILTAASLHLLFLVIE